MKIFIRIKKRLLNQEITIFNKNQGMKKTLLSLLSIIYADGFAQPIVEAANFPVTSHADAFSVENPDNLSPGGSGANQVWDFSGVNATNSWLSIISMDVIPMASAPLAGTFPTANYCIKRVDIEGNQFYTMYAISPNTMEVVGSIYVNSFPLATLPTYLTDTEKSFQFPYTFNTVIDDTSETDISTSPTQVNTVYDGYGTLITPFGTYNNVIRCKETRSWIENTDTYYHWYNTNPFYEIMQGNFDAAAIGGSNNITIYKNTTFLDLPKNEKISFAMYPNPTYGDLFVRAAEAAQNLSASVFDSNGKLVLEGDLVGNTINLKELCSGIYLVKITDQNHATLYSQKVVRK